ncbi:MAG: DNA polymerase III subunit [Tissierellia bacterium]|nr:DNA polymerase III subunit [Tissierellia bacterium]
MDILCNINEKFFKDARILNSYLISGKSGQTVAFAKNFANAILSLGNFSRLEDRIESESHPDVLMFKPENGKYKVEDAREIVSSSYEAPFETDRKIYIIEEFDAFAPLAQNILLKVLEEPQAKTVFILLSENKDKILPTILSRVSEIKVQPASLNDFHAKLKEYEIDSNKLTYLYYFTSGDHISSSNILATEGFFDEKRSLLERYVNYLNGDGVALLEIADYFEKNNNFEIFASVLSFFLRDLSVYNIDKSKIFDQDSVDLFQAIDENIDFQNNILMIDEIRRRVKANVSVRNAILALL